MGLGLELGPTPFSIKKNANSAGRARDSCSYPLLHGHIHRMPSLYLLACAATKLSSCSAAKAQWLGRLHGHEARDDYDGDMGARSSAAS